MNKKFVYECETPGAEFETTLSVAEEKSTGSEFVMESKPIKYTLTVYATAEGYDRSKPATISFVIDRNDVETKIKKEMRTFWHRNAFFNRNRKN